MQWKRALFFGLWLLLIGGGCSRPLRQEGDNAKATVEDGDRFPRALAGRWKARQHGWEWEIEPEGRISWAVLSLGRVRVVPGKTTTMPTKSGDQAVFTPGVWTVHYLPSTRELTVKITMDYVRVEMAGNILEGSSTDVFVGPVDPTGRLWQTQWTTFTCYTAHTPDSTSLNLSTDPTEGETRSLIFEKTEAANP